MAVSSQLVGREVDICLAGESTTHRPHGRVWLQGEQLLLSDLKLIHWPRKQKIKQIWFN